MCRAPVPSTLCCRRPLHVSTTAPFNRAVTGGAGAEAEARAHNKPARGIGGPLFRHTRPPSPPNQLTATALRPGRSPATVPWRWSSGMQDGGARGRWRPARARLSLASRFFRAVTSTRRSFSLFPLPYLPSRPAHTHAAHNNKKVQSECDVSLFDIKERKPSPKKNLPPLCLLLPLLSHAPTTRFATRTTSGTWGRLAFSNASA